MNAYAVFAAIVALMTLSSGAPTSSEACGGYGSMEIVRLTPDIISDDTSKADAAIGTLRDHGAMALHHALAVHNKALALDVPVHALSDQAKRARSALDRLAGQKDAHASRLFWHTDFAAAKRAAKESGKPILSLRLLGKLDEDLSCANSRFFRTALYSNKELSAKLRSQFVLHWKSVRPVPVITVDFGDGRKICRTITGNSIHYVLMPDGQVVDALPGLYGPAAFARRLDAARELFAMLKSGAPKSWETTRKTWHHEASKRTALAWESDLARLKAPTTKRTTLRTWNGPAPQLGHQPKLTLRSKPAPAPSAERAGRLTTSKGIVELPMIRRVFPNDEALRAATDDPTWARLAGLHADDARLDDASKDLMRAKTHKANDAMFSRFESSMARDSVRNEYDFHLTLHKWFANGTVSDVDALNERVYAELFLTPSSDAWLGLVPDDSYAGLDQDGLATPSN